MLKAVIFDMDGVIIDSEPLHCEVTKLVMREYGIELSDYELNNFAGISNPSMWTSLRKRYNITEDINVILKKQLDTTVELFNNPCPEIYFRLF